MNLGNAATGDRLVIKGVKQLEGNEGMGGAHMSQQQLGTKIIRRRIKESNSWRDLKKGEGHA